MDWISSLPDVIFGIFADLIKAIISPFTEGVKTVGDLVFGLDTDGSELLWLTFTKAEWNNLAVKGVSIFIQVAYYVLLIGLMYISVSISKSGINPAARTSLLEMTGSFLLVALLLHNLNVIYSLVFSVNRFLVQLIQLSITNGNLSIDNLQEKGLGWLLIWCVYLGLSIWANIYYLMRKFTALLLILFGPVFITMFLFAPLRQVTFTWFKEFVSTIIVQAIHASIFWMFLNLDDSVTDNWLVKIVMLGSFIPLAEGIKGLFGLQATLTGRTATMMMMTGGASLASVFSATKSAMGKDSPFDNLQRKYLGNSNRVGSLNQENQGPSLPANPTSTSTQRMLKTGNFIGNRIGKPLGTLMGSAMGIPFGPGGVISGGITGGNIGSASAGLAGRSLYAIGSSTKKSANRMVNNINSELDNLDKNLGLNQIQQIGTSDGNTDFSKYKGMKYTAGRMYAAGKGVAKGIVPSTLSQLGRVGSAAYKGAKNGAALGSVPSVFSEAYKSAQQEVNLMTNEKIEQNGGLANYQRKQLENAGFAGGILLGESGVELGQKISNSLGNMSGLNRKIQDKGWEFTDLNKQIEANNVKNIRLNITRNFSCLTGDVKQNDGSYKQQRISNYRGGDATLDTNKIVFKDLFITEGRILDGNSPYDQNKDFYHEDSQQGKMKVSKNYNVNPYDYFENRNDGSEKYFQSNRFKQGIV
ncbi:type IV secretion system protein [Brevibacillus laterosporus]|uniref:type IV secretion system protein n=1 Tax=Brevibacillus laterosporus TaxID=1465 RepID=UPI0035A7007B